MTISQRLSPFALSDIDGVAIDFAPDMATTDLLTSPVVTVSGGFTVGTPSVGTVSTTTEAFSVDPAGTFVYVLLTATTVGTAWEVTFTAAITGGRLLHRTVHANVLTARS